MAKDVKGFFKKGIPIIVVTNVLQPAIRQCKRLLLKKVLGFQVAKSQIF